MDISPTADRIRVVVDNGDNFRINPNTGSLIDGDLGNSGPIAGVNKDGKIYGLTSSVQAVSFTNTAPVTSNSTLYTVDALNDQLYIQVLTPQQNQGNQTSALPLKSNDVSPLAIDTVFGFDIPFGVNAPDSDNPVTNPSSKGIIGVSIAGVYKLGSINLFSGVLSTSNLPSEVGIPISLSLNTNKTNSYPIILLSNGGTSISRFGSETLATVSTTNINGIAAGDTLVGIDYRPAKGQLLGLVKNSSNDTGTLYTIDPQSGVAKSVTAIPGAIAFIDSINGNTVDFPANTHWSIDVNPKRNRVRVVSSSGLNFRVHPSTGLPQDGDPGTGMNPDRELSGASNRSDGVAFTNNVLCVY
jgi:hypothetical protein